MEDPYKFHLLTDKELQDYANDLLELSFVCKEEYEALKAEFTKRKQ